LDVKNNSIVGVENVQICTAWYVAVKSKEIYLILSADKMVWKLVSDLITRAEIHQALLSTVFSSKRVFHRKSTSQRLKQQSFRVSESRP
jgi:hypothetical protein